MHLIAAIELKSDSSNLKSASKVPIKPGDAGDSQQVQLRQKGYCRRLQQYLFSHFGSYQCMPKSGTHCVIMFLQGVTGQRGGMGSREGCCGPTYLLPYSPLAVTIPHWSTHLRNAELQLLLLPSLQPKETIFVEAGPSHQHHLLVLWFHVTLSNSGTLFSLSDAVKAYTIYTPARPTKGPLCLIIFSN